jgi:hypothetical protein
VVWAGVRREGRRRMGRMGDEDIGYGWDDSKWG